MFFPCCCHHGFLEVYNNNNNKNLQGHWNFSSFCSIVLILCAEFGWFIPLYFMWVIIIKISVCLLLPLPYIIHVCNVVLFNPNCGYYHPKFFRLFWLVGPVPLALTSIAYSIPLLYIHNQDGKTVGEFTLNQRLEYFQLSKLPTKHCIDVHGEKFS